MPFFSSCNLSNLFKSSLQANALKWFSNHSNTFRQAVDLSRNCLGCGTLCPLQWHSTAQIACQHSSPKICDHRIWVDNLSEFLQGKKKFSNYFSRAKFPLSGNSSIATGKAQWEEFPHGTFSWDFKSNIGCQEEATDCGRDGCKIKFKSFTDTLWPLKLMANPSHENLSNIPFFERIPKANSSNWVRTGQEKQNFLHFNSDVQSYFKCYFNANLFLENEAFLKYLIFCFFFCLLDLSMKKQ